MLGPLVGNLEGMNLKFLLPYQKIRAEGMEYKKLGSTDLIISRIGFGGWAIGGYGYGQADDQSSIKTIKTALEAGINFFDTADVYGFGHSEKILTKALGPRRHEVTIATKFGLRWNASGAVTLDCSPKRVTEALEASLRRLKLDCIPLYQIHKYDPKTPLTETMAALKKCQAAGKIRYIGCSNFSASSVSAAGALGRLESNQLLYNLIQRETESDLKQCEKNGLSIIAYSVLARGLFSGKFNLSVAFSDKDTRARDPNFSAKKLKKNLEIVELLKKIGRSYRKTPGQVAIRWVLDNPAVTTALAGAKTPEQILENIQASDWHLTTQDKTFIDALYAAP